MPNYLYDLPEDIQDKIFGDVYKRMFNEVIQQLSDLINMEDQLHIMDLIEHAKRLDRSQEYHAFDPDYNVNLNVKKIIETTSFKSWKNYTSWKLLKFGNRHLWHITYRHTCWQNIMERSIMIKHFPKGFEYFYKRWHEREYRWFHHYSGNGLDYKAFRMGLYRPQAYTKIDLCTFLDNNGIIAYKSWTHKRLYDLVFEFNFPNFVRPQDP
jgi:Fe-S cluster biosynthesis and repair protein YggX